MNELPSLDTLALVIPEHEVKLVQECLLVLRESGIIVDMSDFVTQYLRDGNYIEDPQLGLVHSQSSTYEEEVQKKMRLRATLFSALNEQRTVREIWQVITDHEVWYLGYVYYYSLGNGYRLDPVRFVDSVAEKRGFRWDNTQRKYTNTDIVLE